MSETQSRYKSKTAKEFFEKYGDNSPVQTEEKTQSTDALSWTKYVAYGLNFVFLLALAFTCALLITSVATPDVVASPENGSVNNSNNGIATIYFVFGIIAAFALGGLVSSLALGYMGRRDEK